MRRLVAVMLLAGCGSAPPAQTCMPGSVLPCACPLGITGKYTCSSDGTGFGECTGCTNTAEPLQVILKTCAMGASCLQEPILAPSGSRCVASLEQALASGVGTNASALEQRDLVECVSKATDCVSALTCATQAHGPAYCDAHSGYSCDGDLAIFCGTAADFWPVLHVQDCAALGEHCMAANGGATCTDGTTCMASGATCKGNRSVTCDPTTHLESSVDCGAQLPDFVCDGGSGLCVSRNKACSGSANVRCDSNNVVQCVNGHEVEVDCMQLGGNCANAACVPDGTDCTAQSPDRCNGTSLEMCAGGKYVGVDCTSIGFNNCGMNAGGNPACVP